jgi:hypothetical protein
MELYVCRRSRPAVSETTLESPTLIQRLVVYVRGVLLPSDASWSIQLIHLLRFLSFILQAAALTVLIDCAAGLSCLHSKSILHGGRL